MDWSKLEPIFEDVEELLQPDPCVVDQSKDNKMKHKHVRFADPIQQVVVLDRYLRPECDPRELYSPIEDDNPLVQKAETDLSPVSGRHSCLSECPPIL